jgi:5-methylcytosine-specific restriction endonuclease McrA
VGSDGYVCRQCHRKYVWAHRSGLDEERRTVGQRWRAHKRGLPATLTVVEWVQTLIDFEYRCAYCRGSFHDLEHYVPISQGGGTTVDNCVPACSSCNSSKVRPNVRSSTRRVSAESLDRVGGYLQNRVQRTPVTAERAGQTLPIPMRYWTDKYHSELAASGHNPHAEALAARFVRARDEKGQVR